MTVPNAALALRVATEAHAGQNRAGGDAYITHPVRVASTVQELVQGRDAAETLICAALLHDTIEDTSVTESNIADMFGSVVANLVVELTSDPDQVKELGKTVYLQRKMAKMSADALLIKLADRLDNVQDITTARTAAWREKYRNETNEILDYIERNRVLSDTHRQLIDAIREKLQEVG